MKILIADPPWEGNIQRPKRNKDNYEHIPDYPRLPLNEIQKLLREAEGNVDCSLVWTIDRYILDELSRQSRFPTRRTLIWYKVHAGIGWNVRYAHEYIILRYGEGYRSHFNLPSVIVSPRTDHNFLTSKPLSVLVDLVNAFAGPKGEVVEMFKGSKNLENACKIVGCSYSESFANDSTRKTP